MVMTGGRLVPFKREDTNLRVDCLNAKEKIYIEYVITPGSARETLSYSNTTILLTNFLITPAVYNGTEPALTYSSNIGDPYLYDINDYHVTITAHNSFQIFAPGKNSEKVVGEKKTSIFEVKQLRDFPAVLFIKPQIATVQHGSTLIYFINAEASKEHVIKALNFGENMIGPYQYSELFVVSAQIPLKGMEFSNMVFISDNCFSNSETLRRVVYHEVLHQWFYGIIGTNQLEEPFLDEGMVTYLTSLLTGDGLEDTYNTQFSLRTLKDYTTKQTYNNLAYYNSATYFKKLHLRMGDNFPSLLKRVYNERKICTLGCII